jgi:signal peptidase I
MSEHDGGGRTPTLEGDDASGRRADRRHGRHERSHGPRRKRHQLPFWQELPLLLLLAIVLAVLLKTFLVALFYIPSESMEETLQVRDRVAVNKLVYDFRAPRRGEVIVFNGVDSWTAESEVSTPTTPLQRIGRSIGGAVGLGPPSEKDFIKRIIGVPGDTVQCCDSQGRVTVNGRGIDEPYVFDDNPLETRAFGPVTVAKGRLWVMGDHRGVSRDSRAHITDQFQGTIPMDHVVGRAFAVVWPPHRMSGLPVPSGFGAVPAALGAGAGRHDRTGGAAVFALPLVVPLLLRRRDRTARSRSRGRP